MKLTDQVAVVTGGASGIGRATTEAFAELGATVVIADLDEERGHLVAAELSAQGYQVFFHPLDVMDFREAQALASSIGEQFGRIDVLANVAGWDRSEPFMDNSEEFWDKVVSLNLLGPVRVTRAFLPLMIEGGGGVVVNVASDAGRVGSAGETIYAGAKGGVIAFTKSLAREMVRHGIRVNCVCPGPTDTPLFAQMTEQLQAALVKAIPMRRLADPVDIANAIAFFASDRSSYITGQVLSVSGGLTMVD